jgi:hypothetical protein
MKKITTFIFGLFISFIINAQNTGEICLIGANSDSPDKVLIVTLIDLTGSQVIYFTDNEWDSSAWTTGEGFKVYTAPATGLTAGDVIEIDFGNNTASEGSVASGSGNLNLSASGDQLYMYLGSDENTPTTFLFALNTKGGWAANELTNTGLTDGTNALTFANSTDNVEYIGTRAGTIADLQNAIADVTNNWDKSGTPFTFDLTDFTISGASGNSTESDIIKTSGWAEPENIAYQNYQTASGLTTANSLEVGKFTIRDGGATANDADAVATILTAITLQINNYANIRAIALFSGTTNLSEVTAVTYNTTLSGISGLSAADNDSTDFTIRVTFTSTVDDNENLRFLITSTSVDAAGSDFSDPNAGGAHTDNSGDKNKIVVVADRLAISTPSSVNMNNDFPVTVNAVDINNNLDVDENSSVSLTLYSGTGTLSSASGLTQSMSNGTYSWSDIRYDTAEDIQIEGQSATLSHAISNTITVNSGQNLSLIISEVADPKDGGNAKYVELYNAGSSTIDFSADTWYLCRQSNGSSWGDVKLTGIVAAGETHTIAYHTSDFKTAFGIDADQGNTKINGNGNDGYFLYEGNNHAAGTLMDAYGVIDKDGAGTRWLYEDGHAVRKRDILSPNNTWTENEWIILNDHYGTGANSDQMTPDRHRTNVNWDGSASTNWNDTTNWSTGFVPDASDVVHIPSTTNKPIINRDAMAYDLDIAMDMSLEIAAGKQLTVKGSLNNNNDENGLILKSDNTGTANLLAYSPVEMKVETYVTEDIWHMIAPPVNGDTSGVYVDLYLMEYNENDSSWTYITPLNIALNLGKSHFVWSASSTTGNATVVHRGAMQVSDKTVSLDYTSSNPHPGGIGWTMIGNPFTTNLTFNSEWTFTNADETIYIWDQTAGNYKSMNTSGVGAADSILAVAQGFWMRAQSAGASVTIPVSERRNYKNKLQKHSIEKIPNYISLSVAGNNFEDVINIQFNDCATAGFDAKFDAYKMRGNTNAPQLYMIQNEIKLTTNVLPFVEGMTIHCNLEVGEKNTYTITLNNTQYPEHIYLEDKITGEYIDLTTTDYTFIASPEDAKSRFNIHFANPNAVQEQANSPIQIYSEESGIVIRSQEKLNSDIALYNVLGQKIVSEKMEGYLKKIHLNNISGYVIVKIISNDKLITKKLFVR